MKVSRIFGFQNLRRLLDRNSFRRVALRSWKISKLIICDDFRLVILRFLIVGYRFLLHNLNIFFLLFLLNSRSRLDIKILFKLAQLRLNLLLTEKPFEQFMLVELLPVVAIAFLELQTPNDEFFSLEGNLYVFLIHQLIFNGLSLHIFDQLDYVPAWPRSCPENHFIKNESNRPNIALCRVFLISQQLGRHI